jgi:MoxR-like ATPase
MSLSPAKQKFVDLAAAKYGEGAVLEMAHVTRVREENNLGWPSWFVRSPYRVGRGQFKLPVEGESITPIISKPKVEKPMVEETAVVAYHNPTESLVPSKDPLYVPFGHFNDIYSIVKSGMYYPAFVTGLSGNGKTFMIEQACAKAKREFFRVNITVETDEDDLLGHYALIDGNTVWQDGPVVKAMERGAVLLLDEIDLASSKIMCLQPVLEGNGVFLKKVNRFVAPSKGFTVLATANTKGKGSEDGRFIGTNILNEAFLERFPITVEQEYPSMSVERKILDKVFASLDVDAGDFSERLVTWADIIRKTFYEGGIDEIIATRRLVHIANAYAIFGDRKKAIEMCIARFDEDTKTSFLDLYSKVDEEVSNAMANEAGVESETKSDDADDLTPF